MPVIQSPGAQRRLQQAYELVGEPPAPTLSPEIVPVTLVDDLSLGAGTGTGGGGGPAPGATIPPIAADDPLQGQIFEKSVVTAASANYHTVTLYNPRGSNVLALISHISGTATNADLSVCATVFTSHLLASPAIIADRGYQRDTRMLLPGDDPLLTGLSACGVFQANSAVAPGCERHPVKIVFGGDANLPQSSRFVGLILRPNSGVTYKATLANQIIRLNFVWIERQLLQGEPNGT